MDKPLLLIDIDGVISLYGFDPARPPEGKLQFVDGIAHFLSAAAGEHLRRLASSFELAWCSGWEEKANEYLPWVLKLPGPLRYVRFPPIARLDAAHWKLAGIEAFVAPQRPVAWLDDAHDERCRQWAEARSAPTLLVATEPSTGLTGQHVIRLLDWVARLEKVG
jgi:hypothetical protein